MTMQKKLAEILAEIDAHKGQTTITNQDKDKMTCEFVGRIGADVNFTGMSTSAVAQRGHDRVPREYTYQEVELTAFGERLARIGCKNGLLNLSPTEQVPTTLTWIVSPRWDGFEGHVSATKGHGRINEIHVFHASDEMPDRFVDYVGGVIAQNKQKAADVQKLSKLIIATKAADLTRADNTQDDNGVEITGVN